MEFSFSYISTSNNLIKLYCLRYNLKDYDDGVYSSELLGSSGIISTRKHNVKTFGILRWGLRLVTKVT
jgi:hypothetical protein